MVSPCANARHAHFLRSKYVLHFIVVGRRCRPATDGLALLTTLRIRTKSSWRSIEGADTTTELTRRGGHGSAPPVAAGRIRLLLVEPRGMYAAAIAKCLGDQQFAVEVADSEARALELLWATDPDVVVVCVGSHHRGVELLDRLREESTLPLIVVTDAEMAAPITQRHPPIVDGLIPRIRNALRPSRFGDAVTNRWSTPVGARHRAVGALDVDLAARRVLIDGQPVALTRTEFEVLAMLFARPGEVVSRRELQDQLWGLSWTGNRYTLDMHVGNLRRKLSDDAGAPRYVITVRGVGYRLGI